MLGVSKAEEREKGSERLCIETIAENFPSLGKEPNAHIHRGIIIGHRISMAPENSLIKDRIFTPF